MDTSALSFLSPRAVAARLSRPDAPWLVDVRREPAFQSSSEMLAGALRCAPDKLAAWAAGQSPREVVVYCVYGHQVSAQAAAVLTELGWQAHVLAGGFMGGEDGVDAPANIAEWRASALPRMPKPSPEEGPSDSAGTPA
jgi:rhodanese-related sulfurtransferase